MTKQIETIGINNNFNNAYEPVDRIDLTLLNHNNAFNRQQKRALASHLRRETVLGKGLSYEVARISVGMNPSLQARVRASRKEELKERNGFEAQVVVPSSATSTEIYISPETKQTTTNEPTSPTIEGAATVLFTAKQEPTSLQSFIWNQKYSLGRLFVVAGALVACTQIDSESPADPNQPQDKDPIALSTPQPDRPTAQASATGTSSSQESVTAATSTPSVEEFAQGGGLNYESLKEDSKGGIDSLHHYLFVQKVQDEGGNMVSRYSEETGEFSLAEIPGGAVATSPQIDSDPELGYGGETAFIGRPGEGIPMVVSVGNSSELLGVEGASLLINSVDDIRLLDINGLEVGKIENRQWVDTQLPAPVETETLTVPTVPATLPPTFTPEAPSHEIGDGSQINGIDVIWDGEGWIASEQMVLSENSEITIWDRDVGEYAEIDIQTDGVSEVLVGLLSEQNVLDGGHKVNIEVQGKYGSRQLVIADDMVVMNETEAGWDTNENLQVLENFNDHFGKALALKVDSDATPTEEIAVSGIVRWRHKPLRHIESYGSLGQVVLHNSTLVGWDKYKVVVMGDGRDVFPLISHIMDLKLAYKTFQEQAPQFTSVRIHQEVGLYSNRQQVNSWTPRLENISLISFRYAALLSQGYLDYFFENGMDRDALAIGGLILSTGDDVISRVMNGHDGVDDLGEHGYVGYID